MAYRIEVLTDRSGGPDACWPWMGNHFPKGYGRLRWRGKDWYVSRLVYERGYGHLPPPDKPFVLHHCDNPPCANPKHLFAGTKADNARDRDQKGRGIQHRGEAHGRSKLKAVQVVEIRKQHASGEVTHKQLAEQFKCCPSTVGLIVSRKIWRCVA